MTTDTAAAGSADAALQYLVAHSPAPVAPVTPALLKARRALDAAAAEYLAVPDVSLEHGWDWDGAEADVRYGLFRGIEAAEAATAEIAAILAANDARRSNASLRI